jgi:hypothetical protein
MDEIKKFEKLADLTKGVEYYGKFRHEGSDRIAVICENSYCYAMFCIKLYVNGLEQVAYEQPLERAFGINVSYAWDKAIFNEERKV